jgi:CubicO group peptidase (beta-lactamase class C family)
VAIKIEQRPGRVYHNDTPSSWPVSTLDEAGMDTAKIDAAARFARDHGADSLLVLRHGKLAHESYWNGKTPTDLQQTFSGTKSVFSLLVGRLIQRGVLRDLDQAVCDFIPELAGEQRQLTVRNILAMQSGMENSPEIEALGATGQTQMQIALERRMVAPPLTQYHYNNAPYRLLFTALERASGESMEDLTEAEVFRPLGFAGACWVRIYAMGSETVFTGYQSIRMTPRDFAKSSQVIIDGGLWQGQRYLPAAFVAELVRPATPAVNPSFGLFHHLNAGAFCRDYAVPKVLARKLVPGAPDDTFLMFGAGGQVTIGIPSLSLVIVRTGQSRSAIFEADNAFARLIRLVVEAA